jgi:hypothetical protein
MYRGDRLSIICGGSSSQPKPTSLTLQHWSTFARPRDQRAVSGDEFDLEIVSFIAWLLLVVETIRLQKLMRPFSLTR